MQEMKDFHREGEKLLYPRMIIRDCCGTDELAARAAGRTTLNPAEVKAALGLVARAMAWLMAEGRSVRIDGVGLFTPSLSLRKGKEREAADGSGRRRNAGSIEVGGVNFRPSKELLRETNCNCRLTRASGRIACRESEFTPEERLAMAQRYLEANAILTVSVYAALTGLSRTTAGRELRRWRDTPGSGIGIEGRGSHRVYVRAPRD